MKKQLLFAVCGFLFFALPSCDNCCNKSKPAATATTNEAPLDTAVETEQPSVPDHTQHTHTHNEK